MTYYNNLGCSYLELPKYLSSCFHKFNQESVYIQLQNMFKGSNVGQGALPWGCQWVIKTMKTTGMCSCLCVNVCSFVLRLSSSLAEFVYIFPVVCPNSSSLCSLTWPAFHFLDIRLHKLKWKIWKSWSADWHSDVNSFCSCLHRVLKRKKCCDVM